MDWAYELIGLELEKYVASKERVEARLKGARDYWQIQLDKGRISEREAEIINGLLGSVAAYQDATKELLEGIGWMYNALGISPEENKRLRAKILELEIALEKYKVVADPRLHPYIKIQDIYERGAR